MTNAVRWGVLVVTVLLVLGIVAYARGPQHHRGDETGAISTPATATVTGVLVAGSHGDV